MQVLYIHLYVTEKRIAMNILVLGGNGYLGSKIVKQLVLKNSNVFSTIREQSD